MEEEQNRGRGQVQTAFEQALAHERATHDQRRESESRERQRYAREREEQIDFEQSEPYPMPMSEPDPPTRPEPSSQGGTKPKTKLSLEDYRNRQHLEQSQVQSAEAKVEQARMHEIRIRQAEVARIEQEQEQLCLEQERVQREQEANAALLASQAQQVPAAFGSHTPCYDEHGQELDYHDDVPAADSQECKTWSDYFRQRGDEYGIRIAEQLDAEHELLHGPTMPSTVSEEAVLLDEEMPVTELEEETPTVELVEETPNAELEEAPTAELLEGPTPTAELLEELTPTAELLEEPMPTAELLEEPTPTAEEGIPTVDMRQFLAGLETLTPEMLSEILTHIERLCQLAAPLASTKSAHTESPPPPPGLPTTPTVPNPMEQALLKVTSNLGTSPSRQRTPTRPPGAEETERAAAQLVEQMAKAPGTPS